MINLKSLSNLEILGLTIIGEARGEPIEGQVAVGSVIRNRFNNAPTKYKSYNDVCLEPYQFSCWNEKDPNRAFLVELAQKMIDGQEHRFDAYLQQCMYVAQGIREMIIIDNTRGCRFYMERSLYKTKRPSWAKDAINIREIGNHIFFNLT